MRGFQLSDVIRRCAFVLGCGGLAACSSTQAVREQAPAEAVGNQGGAWETVLGTPEAPLHEGWEVARLDDAMNIRGSVENNPPSLDDLRRLFLHPRPDQVLYYRRRW